MVFVCGCAISRPWTKQEKVALWASTAATIADAYTTDRVLDNGGRELNPVIKGSPVVGVISFQMIAIIISHYWPEIRIPLLGGKAVVNGACAIHNYNESNKD